MKRAQNATTDVETFLEWQGCVIGGIIIMRYFGVGRSVRLIWVIMLIQTYIRRDYMSFLVVC